MTTKIITTFDSGKQYKNHGEEMLRSFNRFIQDDNIHMFVYYDGDPSDITKFHKCTDISFLDTCGQDHKDFCAVADKKQKGKVTNQANSNKYEDEKQFLFDAKRFSYKWFAMIEAYYEFGNTSDYLVWIDADTLATAQIKEDFFENMIDEDELLSYLGRIKPYTETGFVLFNCKHPHIDDFFDRMEDFYHRRELFSLSQWIDCVAFDTARLEMESYYGAKCRNLTPNDVGHVWERSPLANRIIHNKGLRKVK